MIKEVFKRQEVHHYTVEPSVEGKEILAQEAVDRIVNVDGVDRLDGWELPPDNEKIYNPRTITLGIYSFGQDPGSGEVVGYKEVRQFPSSLTNGFIRACNIRCIAVGHDPIFQTWEQVKTSIHDAKEAQREKRQ